MKKFSSCVLSPFGTDDYIHAGRCTTNPLYPFSVGAGIVSPESTKLELEVPQLSTSGKSLPKKACYTSNLAGQTLGELKYK